jgi:hypothetical protein
MPTFSSFVNLLFSTYQNTGTSDFRIMLKHRQTGVYVESVPWRSSTGGVYYTLDTWTFTEAMVNLMNYKLVAQFKDAGAPSTSTSSFWLETPLIDYEVAPGLPELLANILSVYVRGDTIEYQCDITSGIRKSGVPSTTTMTIGVKVKLNTAQAYFDEYLTTVLLANELGIPMTWPDGSTHRTSLLANSTLITSQQVPITTTNPVII